MKVRFSTRIVLSFLFLVAVIVGSVSLMSYWYGSRGLQEAALREMKLLAEEKTAELNSWTEERSIDALLISKQEMLTYPDLYRTDISAYERIVAENTLRQFLRGPHQFYLELFVMDSRTGDIVVSTSNGETGKNRRGYEYFEKGRFDRFIHVSRNPADVSFPTVIASAPIKTQDGAVIGVLGIRMDPQHLQSILERGRHDHETLDAFLVNSERFLITKPRFLLETVAHVPLATEAVEAVTSGRSGVLTANDYRGVGSIAAFQWNDKRNLGLIVKVDEQDALAPARHFGIAVIWISAVALLMALFLALFLARSITRPVRKLRQRVQEFAQNDPQESGSTEEAGEIELLAREFDRMAKRIDDRTSELADTNLALQFEVDERKQTAEGNLADQERYIRQRSALIALTEHPPGDIGSIIKFLTKLSAETLDVGRVSIWGYSSGKEAIECIDLYSRETDEHQAGQRLEASEYPHYFDSLSESKLIPADQARTDDRTREFSENYLKPLGITSMLDVPIHVGGSLYGVLCHEHLRTERTWTADEQSFALAVAGAFSLAVERNERRAAENTLRASEERLSAITLAAEDAILMMDAEGLVCFWNPAAERIFGYTSDEVLGKNLHDLIVPKRYHAAHDAAFPEFQNSGRGAAIGKTLDLEAIQKGGTEIDVQLSLSSVQIDEEWHSIGIIRDVTERKREMEQLREAHAQLDHVFTHSPGVIYRVMVEGSVILPLTISQNIEKLLGFTPDEVLSVAWWMDSIHADDREKAVREINDRSKYGSLRTEYRLRHKDGTYRWIADSRRVDRNADGKIVEMIGVIMDITDKKIAEEKLAESRELYDDLFENATDMIQAIRPDGSIAYVNRAWREALGYAEDELAKLSMFDIIPKEQHEHCITEMRAAMSGITVDGVETEFVSKSGHILSVEGNITCKFVDGEPAHTRGIFHDITERKAAETRLREINEGMRLQTAALESTANGVAITNTKGIIEWINPAFTKLTGYSAKDVIGKSPRILNSGKNPEGLYGDLWGTITKGEVWHGDLINRRKDGTFYHEEMTITPVRDAEGKIGHFVAIKQDVTASRKAAERLKISQAKLARAQEIARMGSWEWDLVTDEVSWSDEAYRVLGLTPGIDQATHHSFMERVHPDDRERVQANAADAVATHRWNSIEYRVVRPDGSHGILLSEGVFSGDDADESYKIMGIMLDITARRESENRFRSIVESANDAIILIDNKSEIVSWNHAAHTIFGYERSEVIGHRLEMLFPATYNDEVNAQEDCSAHSVADWVLPGSRGTSLTGLKKSGEKFPLEITVSSWEAENGNFYSAIVRDVTQRKTLEDQLTYQTLHDPLTDLANRVLFQDRVDLAIKRIKRTKTTIGVLFIDLDNFKNVNDTLGHSAGDELLIAVAERIQGCLRETDTAARFGGDEFAVLIDDSMGAEGARMVAKRIHDAVLAPFHLGSNEAHVGTSIGIAISEHGDETPDQLLQNADVAMYIAKTSGKNRYVLFEPHMQEAIVKRVQLETDMRVALQKEEFEVYYQPIVNLHSEEVEGMEALVRWNHPSLGLMTPGEFIRVAEDTHLILDLGKWVIEDACMQARRWQTSVAGGDRITLTVNIATQQFQDDGLVAAVQKALDRSGLPAKSLILEITETTMLLNTDKTLKTIEKLRSLGVRLAIDDFGTGYSSLSYLQRFAIDVLKIDKSFIDTIASGDETSAVARAIISMGHSLRMKTIAEGIETPEQRNELQNLGCQYGQGYHFAKPLRKSDMDAYLVARPPSESEPPIVTISIDRVLESEHLN